jgi:hypothetical protein
MRNRILHLALADIIVDPAAAAARITAACRRQPPLRVTGLCRVGETLVVALEETSDGDARCHVLAPLGGATMTLEEATAAISARFYAGFAFLGACDDGHTRWGLFAEEA